jgi:hypothetical protein
MDNLRVAQLSGNPTWSAKIISRALHQDGSDGCPLFEQEVMSAVAAAAAGRHRG